MRIKQRDTAIPSVNLIPMLNVMLGILAFFVLITMSLTVPTGLEVQLPGKSDSAPPPAAGDDEPPLIVTLGAGSQILIEETPLSEAQAQAQVRQHLAEDEARLVYIKADPQVAYLDLVQFVLRMKEAGGDRVSLAIEEE
ncbi:MAG: biopolymer transporter ExbD [Cyanobacteria bacterium P01_A01_bin.135]